MWLGRYIIDEFRSNTLAEVKVWQYKRFGSYTSAIDIITAIDIQWQQGELIKAWNPKNRVNWNQIKACIDIIIHSICQWKKSKQHY